MYRVEVKNGIKQLIAVYQCVGLWDVKDESTCSKKWKRFLLFFYATFTLSFGCKALTTADKTETVFLSSLAIAGVVETIRLNYIMRKRSEIVTFIYEAGSHIINDRNEFKKVGEKLNNFFKFVKYLLLTITFTITLSFFVDAISEDTILPINIAFPLDRKSALGYWMAFTYLAVQCYFSILIFSFNFIIWYLMLSFAIKYDLLGNQLSHMGNRLQKQKLSETEKQNIFLQDLVAAVESYQIIRETINKFKSCFSNLFFIQIASSSLGLCGATYTLSFISYENVFQMLVNSLALVYYIFDIFMLMYLGNEIKLSSDRLSYCLFESNWMDQSHFCKKCIIIFAEILRRPHELVVGWIYRLNLETFRRIVNLAYNMFNFLQNLY